ncbi:hypothetical protein HOLleu_18785 [Holothuria leucospilota]|uniref:Uncharacterized protein n=1 Tax=Holothuria leucospilota TaxID=206669 RepID=A0A9Q1H9E3_HOLLE|nr:hypothetical protein HOLleu_18785 [Holothuria leucospilota]
MAQHSRVSNPIPWAQKFLLTDTETLTAGISMVVKKNIDGKERKAIYDLRNDTSIVVKPADKGGATVILNRETYTNIALEQLMDETFYRILPQNPLGEYTKELSYIIAKFPQPHKDELKNLIPTSPKPGVFYILPKIHELRDKIPEEFSDWISFAKEYKMTPPGRPIHGRL